MSIPKLKKIKSEKKYHDLTLSDEYAWVDQPNILEVLKDASKLDSEVKDYISGNNKITEDYFKDVKDLQKNLFQEIKSKIKLDDTSLKFKDNKYFYWAKTEAKGNYGKKIRQLMSSKPMKELCGEEIQPGKDVKSDKELLNLIVNLTSIEGKSILEIGPGTGNLTSLILEKKPKKFCVVEKDNDLAKKLTKNYKNKIKIINEDILKIEESLS